ncbi:DNA-3-methyladenine glycosylase family protein [Sphingomonas qomolangmaensis]|uniref:DNA-3-methyladenine glycosylase II n=1 Tax=Sphingomonas qomolangmaensis TaxID=2918765 RepID=A0ABY5L7S3_9SPHN|nr:DNA-3-methyladenine glycosylase 2 family protein [Sphingomonas qomolangmaensis]UUL82206.1 DNA-3-methyladenine glycosylase 2 family protein [Sphingomonas qomolangmaensis]
MGLSGERLRADLDSLAAIEPAFAAAIARAGYPAPRIREPGHETLLRTIVGQQVSTKAADSVWKKIEATLGGDAGDTAAWAAASDEMLRGAGLSRQKMGYSRSLCALVASGELDLANLPADDEAAIAQLVKVKGIGRWSAEIYLLFAEGRPDIWPAGDLAVQIEVGRILGMEARPSEPVTREVAEAWRPYRGAAAIFAWHHYGSDMVVI